MYSCWIIYIQNVRPIYLTYLFIYLFNYLLYIYSTKSKVNDCLSTKTSCKFNVSNVCCNSVFMKNCKGYMIYTFIHCHHVMCSENCELVKCYIMYLHFYIYIYIILYYRWKGNRKFRNVKTIVVIDIMACHT